MSVTTVPRTRTFINALSASSVTRRRRSGPAPVLSRYARAHAPTDARGSNAGRWRRASARAASSRAVDHRQRGIGQPRGCARTVEHIDPCSRSGGRPTGPRAIRARRSLPWPSARQAEARAGLHHDTWAAPGNEARPPPRIRARPRRRGTHRSRRGRRGRAVGATARGRCHPANGSDDRGRRRRHRATSLHRKISPLTCDVRPDRGDRPGQPNPRRR